MNITPEETKYLRERIRRDGKQDEAIYRKWLTEFRAKNAAPALPGLVQSTCPACKQEHRVDPKDYPYGMNPTGVLCRPCVFKIED